MDFITLYAYVMTNNKYQGQIFEYARVCLNDPVFCHGQLYNFTLSRSKNLHELKFFVNLQEKLPHNENTFTQNIVYNKFFTNIRTFKVLVMKRTLD